MDVFSVKERSHIMRQVRGKDTGPEKLIRSFVHGLGYRFRLHQRSLPGAPDLVFPSTRRIILVHGCFWHGHTCARGARRPKSNESYWNHKIERNIFRDRLNWAKLRAAKWKVLVLWECQLRDRKKLSSKVLRFLPPRLSSNQQSHLANSDNRIRQ